MLVVLVLLLTSYMLDMYSAWDNHSFYGVTQASGNYCSINK